MSDTQATRYRRNGDLIAVDMDGETVMMSLELGEYFGLNGIGGEIWALLEQPQSQAELCAHLCARYEVSPEACAADVAEFIAALLARQLVSAA